MPASDETTDEGHLINSERAEDKKDRRIRNKLLKDNDASRRETPVSEQDRRGRKPKKVI